MPSSPASAAKRLTAGSSCSDRIAAPSEARFALDDVGHLRRLHVVGAGLRPPRGTSRSTVSMFSCDVRRGAKLDAGGGERHVACLHRQSRRVELAARLQCVKVVAAADMLGADEDLRKGEAAGALDHLFPLLRRAGRVDLLEGYAHFLEGGDFAAEQ